jgi:Lectin C-type domain
MKGPLMSLTKFRTFAIILTISTWCAAALPARSAPVQWTFASGGNGHYYQFVSTKTNWESAEADAESRSFLGISGHLATIANAAENHFVNTMVTDGSELIWLGLTDKANPAARNFFWVDDPNTIVWHGTAASSGGFSPSGSYTNWDAGEPNNAGGNENYTILYTAIETWNDTLVNRLGDGASYVVEFDVVPEPSGIVLSAGAVGLLFAARRSTSPAKARG